jgi:hypothetical protein
MEGVSNFCTSPNDYTGFLNAQACTVPDEAGGEITCAWMIRNHLLEPLETTYKQGRLLDFSRLGFKPGDPITELDWKFKFSTELDLVYDNTTYDHLIAIKLPVKSQLINLAIDPVQMNTGNPGPPPADPVVNNEGATLSIVRRGMPNIDLNAMENLPQSVEGYAGDRNACAPASVANSIHWLEKRYDNIEDKGTTLREKLVDVSGRMNRKDNTGTSDVNVMRAKLGYMNANDHAVKVEFQSVFTKEGNIDSPNPNDLNKAENKKTRENGYPTWEFLVNAIKSGKNVELSHTIFDTKKGETTGSHIVMVTGVREIGEIRQFSISDDANQDATDKVGLRNNVWVDWTENETGPFWGSFANNPCIIRVISYLICEGYDSEVTQGIYGGTGNLVPNIKELVSATAGMPQVPLFVQMIVDPTVQNQILDLNHFTSPEEQTLPPRNFQRLQDNPNWTVRNVIIPENPEGLDTLLIWWAPEATHLPFNSGDTSYLNIGLGDEISSDGNFKPTFTPSRPIGTVSWQLPDGTHDETPLLQDFFRVETPPFTSFDKQVGFIPEFDKSIDLDSMQYPADQSYAGDWNG